MRGQIGRPSTAGVERGDVVAGEDRVGGQQGERLGPRLDDEHPIERIRMVPGKPADGERVVHRHRQGVELATLQFARQADIGRLVELKPPECRLDGDLTGRRRADPDGGSRAGDRRAGLSSPHVVTRRDTSAVRNGVGSN